MKNLILSVVGFLLLVNSALVMAEKPEWRAWPLGQRFNVGLAAFRPKIDTKLNLVAGPIQGQIDAEQNFGLDETKSSPILNMNWRFAKRHSLRFDYFVLDRSGQGTAPASLRICPEGEPCVDLPDVDWPINSYIDVDVYNFGYDYSILFSEKLNWSLGLGLSLQDFKIGVLTENPLEPGNLEVESKFTAPLPTLASRFNYAITDKWILDLDLNWLEIDTEIGDSGEFDGRIWGFKAGVRWLAFKNVGFNLNYQYFELKMDMDDGSDFGGAVDYLYRGPRLGVNIFF